MVDTSTEAVTKLLDGVTPGPWGAESGHVQQNGQLYWQVTDKNHAIMQNQFCWCQGDHAANARFIAAARDLVPALLAERDDLRTKLDAAVEALEKLARLGNGNMYGNSDGNMIARATLRAIAEGRE